MGSLEKTVLVELWVSERAEWVRVNERGQGLIVVILCGVVCDRSTEHVAERVGTGLCILKIGLEQQEVRSVSASSEYGRTCGACTVSCM